MNFPLLLSTDLSRGEKNDRERVSHERSFAVVAKFRKMDFF